ncbi:hypothetical protein [Mammaliicoccus sciuri]|uniref:hypothetical protein n=1 Tax=Mammaliicoccus sciuri TaxID=1296 RepID=UPI0021CE285F|nr:hypothetical protein [Mammaliicoccus sciuri]UXV29653.1 hypothetical protein MUA76_01200 [Mammaliicoccus sciuri]
MRIHFDMNGEFLFQGKKFLDTECIQYKLASLELGEQVSVISNEDIDFSYLEKVQLNDIKLTKDETMFIGKVNRFNK